MELNKLISFRCIREYDIQGSKVFVKILYNSKCLLTEKNNTSVHCTQIKSSKDLVENFEKGRKLLKGYFEN